MPVRETAELTISLLVMGILTFLLGRESEPGEKPEGVGAAAVVSTGFPRKLVDDYEQTIWIEKSPQRIVSVTLASDEVLLELLPPERLLACTYFARDPGISGCSEKAAKVAHTVSGDVEEIIALQPDLVLVAGFTPTSNVDLLRGAGLNVFRFGRYDTFADIRRNIVRLGYMTGADASADRLVDDMDSRLNAINHRVTGQAKSTVLYYTPDGYTAGSGTVFDDMLACAGGLNAAAVAGIAGYQNISTEIAVALNPQVVVLAGTFASADGEMVDPLEYLASQTAWQAVSAVRHNRVYVLPAKDLTCISHHVVEGTRKLAQLLHPTCFEDDQ